MLNVQVLNIDINRSIKDPITANVGEVGSRYIKINLTNNGVPVNLSRVNVYLYALKSDGTKIFNNVEVKDAYNGVIFAKLSSQMVAVSGGVKLTLLLTEGENKLCSKVFYLNVDKTIVDDDAIESSDEFNALVSALNKVETTKTEILDIKSNVESLETTVNSSESIRVSSESARVNAENTRKSSETTRVNNENTRVSNEAIRVTNENNRVTQENTRVSSESTRVTQENTRKSNETTRVNEFNQIKSEFNDFKTNVEVVEARTDSSGTVHAKLKNRLDNFDNIVKPFTDEDIEIEYPSIKQDVMDIDSEVKNIANNEIPGIKGQLETIQKKSVVSVTDFGAIGDGVKDDTQSIENAINYCKLNKNNLIFPKGAYNTTKELLFPANIEITGYGAEIKGNVLYQNCKNNTLKGLTVQTLTLDGVWYSSFNDVYADNFYVKSSITYGTYYNSFVKCVIKNTLEVNTSQGTNVSASINQNSFTSCRAGKLLLTGNGLGTIHNNNFKMCDFTPSGCIQDDSKMQFNTLENVYVESGGVIEGNFNIIGFEGTLVGSPKVSDRNHIIGTNDTISQTASDFISFNESNLCKGGEWEYLQSSGIPHGFNTSGTGTRSVKTDENEPSGLGKYLEFTSGSTFTNIVITLDTPPKNCKYISCSFYIKGSPTNITSFSDKETFNHFSLTPLGNDWSLARGTVMVNKTGNTFVRIYASQSSNVVNTIGVSTFVASAYKMSKLPIARKNKAGSTTDRPMNIPIGFSYYDITLSKPIWWNGTLWKDVSGTTV